MRTAPLHKTKLIAIIAAGILLLLLVLSFFLSSKNQGTQENNPSSPRVTFAPSVDDTQNTPEVPVFPVSRETVLEGVTEDIGQWKTTLFADPGNKDWQANKPSDVRFSYDPGNQSVVVTWTDPMPVNTAYAWMIGYSHEPFNPVEMFREENIANIRWNGITLTPGELNTTSDRIKELTLGEFPPTTRAVYFYIYKRLPEKNSTYRDFLYGTGDNVTSPFSQPIVQSL